MPGTVHAQKPSQTEEPTHDSVFCSEFYTPYEAAACAVLMLLCDTRKQMPRDVLALRYRLKSPDSIREKLQRKGLPETAQAAVAALRDVAGLRAVLANQQAVYRFAGLLLQCGAMRLEGVHDYIAAPKASGYRSLHLIVSVPVCRGAQTYCVPAEIQLRTAAMDAWASAEHRLIYKPRT